MCFKALGMSNGEDNRLFGRSHCLQLQEQAIQKIVSTDLYLLQKNLLYSIPAVSDECTVYSTCLSEGKSFK
jgi:hypothetical protein